MKYFLLILALAATAYCADNDGDIIKSMVCDTWKGWGMNFAGSACYSSISSSCNAIFDILPELIDFFKTFDFSKLSKMMNNIVHAYIEVHKQIITCRYYVPHYGWLAVVLVPAMVMVAIHFFTNMQHIISDFTCVLKTWFSGDYYQAGLCLGRMEKLLFF